ncbi:helix-turn-helix domain-containing protein [Sphingobacterium bovistauri]|uniref:Helix-turn-helix domain-containing protein n=1 Tax=Sphingobacterium bovistauri TaxID=2781959 RepID=A0ABS7Z9U1_9SPHI|nr:helix-turn-helix domain-containing protein [Sphingobacterium bovistauri]MCA5005650.1 helix-turn-helix domain-containing protein [Sphingobacterium bovistauri]
MEVDIVTKQDLRTFKSEILEEMRAILQEKGNQMNSTDRSWLRSAEVRKMLRISAGTLQNLRINGTLPYRKIGGTMYYQSQDIHNMMEGRRDNG